MTLVLDENQLNQDNIETINKLASSNNIDLNNQETPLTNNQKVFIDKSGIPHNENIFEFFGEKISFSKDPMATLENCKTAEIIEKINGCRICCDCSSENEYNIFVKEDGIKKFLLSCREDSNSTNKFFCAKPRREFNMYVNHFETFSETTKKQKKANFLHLWKPYKCPFFGYSRPLLEIYLKGKKYGEIKEPFIKCCDPIFEIYNQKNELRYKFYNNCCQAGFIFSKLRCGQCCNVDIPIYIGIEEENFSNNHIGIIKKFPDENYNSITTNTSSYQVKFPDDASAEDKVLLLMGVILMDYRYYGI